MLYHELVSLSLRFRRRHLRSVVGAKVVSCSHRNSRLQTWSQQGRHFPVIGRAWCGTSTEPDSGVSPRVLVPYLASPVPFYIPSCGFLKGETPPSWMDTTFISRVRLIPEIFWMLLDYFSCGKAAGLPTKARSEGMINSESLRSAMSG